MSWLRDKKIVFHYILLSGDLSFTFINQTLLFKVKHDLLDIDSCLLYSKSCVKRPFKNRQNKDVNDKW